MKKALYLLTIVTLLTWGATFLGFYVTGRIERHLDPTFRVYALLSGIGMLLLGGFNFLNRNRSLGLCAHDHSPGAHCDHPEHDHDHDHDHDHEHEHEHEKSEVAAIHHGHEDTTSGIIFSILVLLVPLLFATAYSEDRFSAGYLHKWGKIERQMMQMRIADQRPPAPPAMKPVDSAENPYTRDGIAERDPDAADTPPEPSVAASGDEADSWPTFTLDDLKAMVPQSDAGDFLLDVPQIFYTAGDRELMEVMEGIPVETTAQLMEETLNNPNNTRLKAFRLFIECCAADARPLSIPVDFGEPPPPYEEMGWYRIYGKIHYANENGEIVPLINIKRIEQTTEPMDGLIF